MFFFFFFQAEDGIRDADVTGVQTCALPIWIVIARATTRQRRDAGVKGDVELTVTRHRRMTVLADHTRSAVTADRERTARPGMLRATRRARCDSTVPGRRRSARPRNRINRRMRPQVREHVT